MPPLITEQALARTYDPPNRVDPWDGVELYREASNKPANWGSTRVARAINSDRSNDFEGISRSEVRGWVDDDGKPDAARAVDTARELGWDADEWTETTRALAQLVIGIQAFGSITKDVYAPSWTPSDDENRTVVETALTGVGVDYRHVERDSDRQADEIRPAAHGTRLGRALVVAGSSVGDKNADSVHGLPDWVGHAPIVVKMDLAMILVRGRGVTHEDKATRQIQTQRGPRYFEDVAQLVQDVTSRRATASEYGVTISADAVRELGLA